MVEMASQGDAKLRHQFNQRLSENYQEFVAQWEQKSTLELINNSDEIAATRKCYWGLKRIPLDAVTMEYLLRFQNPLEIVRDQYLIRTDVSTNSFFDRQELPSALESVFTAELDESYPALKPCDSISNCQTMG